MSLDTEPQRSLLRSQVRNRLLTGAAILLLAGGCRDLDAAFGAYCDAGHCNADAASDGGVIELPGEPALRLEPPDSLQVGDCGEVLIRAVDAEGGPLPPAPGGTYAFTLSIAHETPDGGAPPEVHVGASCLGASAQTARWQGETGAGPWIASIRSHREGRVLLQAKADEGTVLATHSAELLVRPPRVKSIELFFAKDPVVVGTCVNATVLFKDDRGEPLPASAGISAKLQRSGDQYPNLFASSDCAGGGKSSIEVSPRGSEATPFSYRPLEGASTVHQFEALITGAPAWLFPSGGLQVELGALQLKPSVVKTSVGACTLLTAVLVDPVTGDGVPHVMSAFGLSAASDGVQLFARGDSSCSSPLAIGDLQAVEAGEDFGFRLKATSEHRDVSWQVTLENTARGTFTTTFLPSAAPDGFIFGPFEGGGPEVFSAAECNSIPVSLFSGVQGIPVPAHMPIHAVISSDDPLLIFGTNNCEHATPEVELEFDPGQTSRDVFFAKLDDLPGTSTLHLSGSADGGVSLAPASQEVTLE